LNGVLLRNIVREEWFLVFQVIRNLLGRDEKERLFSGGGKRRAEKG